MTDKKKKYADLMNRSLDGDLSAEELSELGAYLETDSDARAEFRQLGMTAQMIGQIPMAEPPSNLKANILAHIRSRRQPESVRPALFDGLRNLFRRKIQWRYVYTFSAGMALGVFILAIVTRFPESSSVLDPGNVSGTIARPFVGGMVVTGKSDFDYEQFKGTIAVREGGQAVLLEINVHSNSEINVEIIIDNSDLVPVAVWQPQPYRGAVSIEERAVRLSLDQGTTFDVMFQDLMSVESEIICRISCGSQEHKAGFTIGERE